MLKVVCRAFLTAVFAATVFAGVAVLTVPSAWETLSRWALAPSATKRVKDLFAQYGSEVASEKADVLSVEITQETMQDGTITHWDGDTKYLEPEVTTRKFLKVTSKADNIRVSRIEINRGNCEPLTLGDAWKPVSLKFGESTSLWIVCDPIEAKISTDRGEYTYTW